MFGIAYAVIVTSRRLMMNNQSYLNKIIKKKNVNTFYDSNEFFIKIDYYDEKGNKEINNTIPLNFIINKNKT